MRTWTPAPAAAGFLACVRDEVNVFLEYLTGDRHFRELAPRLRGGASFYAPSFFAPYVLAGVIAERGGGWLVAAADAEAAAEAGGRAVGLSGPRRGGAASSRRALRRRPCAGGARRRRTPAGTGRAGCRRARRGRCRGSARAVRAARAAAGAAATSRPARRRASTASWRVSLGLGYERVDQVRERGQFAVRGGIVDVYPSTGEPLRVDFWGDEIETLRSFSVFSQRTHAAGVGAHALCRLRGRHGARRVRERFRQALAHVGARRS